MWEIITIINMEVNRTGVSLAGMSEMQLKTVRGFKRTKES